jgi:hypothetical protein
MDEQQALEPTAVLTAKLEAQQWQVVFAGLGELQHKFAAPVERLLLAQLQPPPSSVSNGVDTAPGALQHDAHAGQRTGQLSG